MMHNFFCNFFSFFGDHVNNFWTGFTGLILAAYVSYIYFLYIKTELIPLDKRKILILLFVTFIILLIVRLPDFTRHECNPDEGDWITNAITFFNDPVFWFKNFQARMFTRTFTILPLSLIRLFSSEISYSATRVVALIFWTLFLFFYFKTILLLFNKRVALFSFTILTVIISLFNVNDFIAYNSEIPCVFALMLCFYLFIKSLKKPISKFNPLLFGLILPLITLTKEQTVPVVGIFGLSVLFIFSYLKNKESIFIFLSGCIFSILSIIALFLVFNTLNDVILQFLLILEYSKTPVDSPYPTFSAKIYEFVKLIFHRELRVNLFILPVSFLLLVLMAVKKIKLNSLQSLAFFFTLSLFIGVCISIFIPSQLFYHYSILFIFPCSILLGFSFFLIDVAFKQRKTVMIYATLVISLFLIRKIYSNDTFNFFSVNCMPGFQNKLSSEILKIADREDRMAIWGWHNSYFVETQLLMGNRYLYPQYIICNFPSKELVLSQYINDLKKLKPKIFLELIGDDQFYFTEAEHQISHFPELNNYIKANYVLYMVKGNEKLYVLKKK